MNVLVSGSTGLVGEALIEELKAEGHHVTRLVRRHLGSGDPEILWDIEKQKLDPAALSGIEAVVHLAGENIASGRWDAERKARIRNSRVAGTQLLCDALSKMAVPPKVLVCASAVGYYGDRPGETLTEVSGPGKGFLTNVCREWEAACQSAKDKAIRVVNLRLGVVLSPKGGALKAMYWPFQLGLAGNLGLCGKQHMSWVSLEDVVGAILHSLCTQTLQGPVNCVSPNPVTNAEFTDAMRKQLIWPVFPMHYWTPPAPGLAVEALLGEMGKELLLADTKVMPVRLTETGYHFRDPLLKPTLARML